MAASPGPEHRPTGRERILLATEARLRAGQEIRIAEICDEAGASPALVYKHFADRDDLIAEAYARIFAGFASEDLATIRRDIDFASPELEEQIRRFLGEVLLDPARDASRWSRLEALAHARTNPGVAERIAQARAAMVDELTGMALAAKPDWDATRARAFAVIAFGASLGITAMAEEPVPDYDREALAAMLARLLAAPFA